MAEEQQNEVSQENEKEDLYMEPKPKPKVVRVLTVLAYILSVSMAAILLSVYYVFMWDGQPTLARRTDPSMQHRIGLKDYDYPNIYNQNVNDSFTEINYEGSELLMGNGTNLIMENFTTNSNTDSPRKIFPADNANEINITPNEIELSEKLNKVPEPPTDKYDMYTTNSIVTSTEDNLIRMNDDLEDPVNIGPLDIRDNLFYRKYLYNKLVMP